MFAGHFGLAAGVKSKSPEVPLWALMLGTQLLDVVFVPLLLTGIETIDEKHGSGYGDLIIHADYSHSLLGALIIALLAGFIARKLWGKRAGGIIGAVVFSHWILDLVVHRADLPLLPGNLGELPLLGLGVWRFESIAIGLELVLLVVGFTLYSRSLLRKTELRKKKSAIVASGVMGVLLVFSLVTDVLGLF